ncbi:MULTISPECIES: ABC transporter ATP-binding protein [Microbacteriaceae]|uniref:ABC transporter ATP-binding protein n=2 Tax=Micrococcales TaxID=85006 RepID=UPI0009FE6A16
MMLRVPSMTARSAGTTTSRRSAAEVSAHAPVSERSVTFWQLAAPVRGRVKLAGLLSALGAIAGVLPVLFAMELVRILVPGLGGAETNATQAYVIVGALIFGVVLAQALTLAGYGISHVADARLAESLRQRQVDQALRLRLDWFARTGSGRVKKVIQDDVVKVHQLVAHLVPDSANGLVRPLASLVVLFLIDWRIGLIALVPLVLAAASLPLMLKDVTTRFAQYNTALADLSAAVVEFVRGIAPIKVFEASAKGHRRFWDSARSHHRFYTEWMESTTRGSALMTVFTSPGFAVVVSSSGTALLIVLAGADPVLLLPSILLTANIAGPLYLMMQMTQFLREANGAAGSIVEFFELPAATQGDPGRRASGEAVDIDSVTFAYEDGPRALQDVSLALTPGTVTALVGPSGSGKSTLASIVPRLLDPDTGQVRLGGVDTTELTALELYRHIAFVFQQPYLMRMTVRDNIRLARPDATDAQVVAAARAAQIHERIERLPQGYDTAVGEDARLSGGEQQRLSIARAILMDAPILVLDEATAFADPDSEAAIQRALAELTRGRTLLVIAHRLHTVASAHQIAVLDRGTVRERGTHAELLNRNDLYARMWRTYQRARDTPLADTTTSPSEETKR